MVHGRTEQINHEAASRTAPATPGLLNNAVQCCSIPGHSVGPGPEIHHTATVQARKEEEEARTPVSENLNRSSNQIKYLT